MQKSDWQRQTYTTCSSCFTSIIPKESGLLVIWIIESRMEAGGTSEQGDLIQPLPTVSQDLHLSVNHCHFCTLLRDSCSATALPLALDRKSCLSNTGFNSMSLFRHGHGQSLFCSSLSHIQTLKSLPPPSAQSSL